MDRRNNEWDFCHYQACKVSGVASLKLLTHFSAVAYPQGFCFACLLRICEFPGNVIDATKLHQAPIKELAVKFLSFRLVRQNHAFTHKYLCIILVIKFTS